MFFKKNRKGFTLIELIVVIAILAILAAIAIPTFIGVTQDASDTVVLANARTLVSSINAFNALNPGSEISAITKDAAGVTTLKGQLGTWWPGSLTDADALSAVNHISVASNVASVS